MKEITFKAETDEELYFMIDDYRSGYIENHGKPSKNDAKARKIKAEFLAANPVGTLIKSNTRVYKYFPFGKEYPIIDVKVWVNRDGSVGIDVLLQDDKGRNQWKFLGRFIGYTSISQFANLKSNH